MKKGMLLFAFVGLFAIGAQAQSCCSKANATTEQTAVDQEAMDAAMVAATADQTVQARTSATTGKVSFVRTAVNNETGHTTFQEVEYCTKSGKFVNVSPSEKKACTKSATATDVSTGAACCSKGEKKDACCSSKASTTDAAPATDGEAQAVKVATPGKSEGL